MSKQLTIPASSIRGKDWTKLSLDTIAKPQNATSEPRLDKIQGNVQAKCRTPLTGNFERDKMNRLEGLNFFGCPVGKAKGRAMSDTKLGYVAERMNGLEKKYAHYLEELKRSGEILFWRFESHKLRLANKTWYTPDFYIMRRDYSLEIHETKGWMQEDANVKLKTAAELYSEYKFILVKWRKGQWEFKEYGIQK